MGRGRIVARSCKISVLWLIRSIPISIEKNICAGDTRPAGADALENADGFCTIALAQGRVAPGIIHKDDSVRLNPGLSFLETDWPHLRPFLAPVHHDDIERILWN